jgi:nitrate reductase gamma subunit
MNDLAFLTWVRGTGLDIALSVFVFGVLWRLIEIYGLGAKKDLAEPRHADGASGWHTIWRRSFPQKEAMRKSPVTYIGGMVFHIGLAIVVFLFAPHILLVKGIVGFGWPGLPSQIIDLVAVLTMAAMILVLVDRLIKPVKRFLSTKADYITWALTFLPLLTGWLAVQHLLLPYTLMLALHILSVEILLIVLPFSKLFHAFTTFGSRWYNGEVNGHKGVAV